MSSKVNFKKAISTSTTRKDDPKIEENKNKIYAVAYKKFVNKMKAKIDNPEDIVLKTINEKKPYFKRGQNSFTQSVDFYKYNFRSCFNVKYGNSNHEIKVCDIIFKCNENDNGKKTNTMMDELSSYTNDVIHFYSCRQMNWETREPLKGQFVIRARWTCTKPDEEQDNSDADADAGADAGADADADAEADAETSESDNEEDTK
jgi:hypothetical protein